jgi:hypothetical protein
MILKVVYQMPLDYAESGSVSGRNSQSQQLASLAVKIFAHIALKLRCCNVISLQLY